MPLPRNLLGLIYVAIGIFVAASKDDFEKLVTVTRAGSMLAIVLWPLLLRGIDLHRRTRARRAHLLRYNPPPWPVTDLVSR